MATSAVVWSENDKAYFVEQDSDVIEDIHEAISKSNKEELSLTLLEIVIKNPPIKCSEEEFKKKLLKRPPVNVEYIAILREEGKFELYRVLPVFLKDNKKHTVLLKVRDKEFYLFPDLITIENIIYFFADEVDKEGLIKVLKKAEKIYGIKWELKK